MKMNLKKGFTLIELLVVVGIIGILAAVVLASLNSARAKGGDAGVKTNLRNALSQGEVIYNTRTANQNSYISVCTNGTVDGAKGVGENIQAAVKAAGLTTYSQDATQNGSAPYIAICNDDIGAAWAAEVPLRTSGQFWCVDSTGKSKQTTGTSISGTTDTTCQ